MGISQASREFNRLHNNDDSSHSSSIGPDGDFHDESEGGLVSSNHSSRRQSVTLENTLAKSETRWVRILRCLVLLVLLTAAIASSVAVYLYVKGGEEDDFDQEFFGLATRLVDGFHANAKLRVQVMDMLAVSFTSYAIDTNQTWPFVVVPDFEARVTASRVITSSDYLGLYPYVTLETREEWENFTMNNMEWLNESFAYQEEFKLEHNRTVGNRAPDRRQLRYEKLFDDERFLEEQEGEEGELPDPPINATFDGTDGISPEMYRYAREDEEPYLFVVDQGPGPYYPMYQVSPAREWTAIDVNYNINDPFYSASFVDALYLVQLNGVAVFAGVWNVDEEGYIDENDDYDFRTVPAAALFYPVFDKVIGADREVVGIMELDMEFGPLLSAALPRDASPMVAVVSNPCGQTYSYQVHGEIATYLGPEDLHDEAYNDMMLSTRMSDFLLSGLEYNGAPIDKEFCQWTVDVYATQEMEDEFLTDRPIIYMVVVLCVFLFSFLIFAMYDFIVERRQKKVMGSAVNTDHIVASLFPKEFRDRLYREREEQAKQDKKTSKMMNDRKSAFQAESVKEFLSEELSSNNKFGRDSIMSSPPLAELYNDCTVFFADIQGFTSWSSARAPTQVFTLLETLYGAFDKIAKKYKICKIETIGDCYVAITGCPEPQTDHALKMVCFSRDCLTRFEKLTHKLGVTLGPDTRDLAMRVGLHSGPVTAGILRGEKARFQLFGDTVNTASRMESNGQPMKIHCSRETADCLIALGKETWISQREDKIVAKGKGELQTYWITPRSSAFSSPGSVADSSSTGDTDDEDDIVFAISQMPGDPNYKREWTEANSSWVGWLIGMFRDGLKEIAAERMSGFDVVEDCWKQPDVARLVQGLFSDSMQDIVAERMSEFDVVEECYVARLVQGAVDWDSELSNNLIQHEKNARPSSIDLPGHADDQLVDFVCLVAYTFPLSGFHSFQRTCHSIMKMETLLNQLENDVDRQFVFTAKTKFVVMFSILIRDLARNDAAASNQGSNRSSVEMAWNLLMNDGYQDLRKCLCGSKSDVQQFWKLTVNLQLGTERFDQQLSSERNKRWDDAMGESAGVSAGEKAVAVLEQLVMVAQEAHFMQHWDNYIKWSKLGFAESNEASANGLFEDDRSSYWYGHELGNFDGFIIPLAQRIERSGVLSASGRELYRYACQNRAALVSAGKSVFLVKGAEDGESGEERRNMVGADPKEISEEFKHQLWC